MSPESHGSRTIKLSISVVNTSTQPQFISASPSGAFPDNEQCHQRAMAPGLSNQAPGWQTPAFNLNSSLPLHQVHFQPMSTATREPWLQDSGTKHQGCQQLKSTQFHLCLCIREPWLRDFKNKHQGGQHLKSTRIHLCLSIRCISRQ